MQDMSLLLPRMCELFNNVVKAIYEDRPPRFFMDSLQLFTDEIDPENEISFERLQQAIDTPPPLDFHQNMNSSFFTHPVGNALLALKTVVFGIKTAVPKPCYREIKRLYETAFQFMNESANGGFPPACVLAVVLDDARRDPTAEQAFRPDPTAGTGLGYAIQHHLLRPMAFLTHRYTYNPVVARMCGSVGLDFSGISNDPEVQRTLQL